MPITKELENLRKFESAGFTHEQAETLTDVIEQSHVNGQQSLKDFINDKFEELRAEMDNRFKDVRNEFKDVRSEITSSELRIKHPNRLAYKDTCNRCWRYQYRHCNIKGMEVI